MDQHREHWTRGWITAVSVLTAVLVAVVEHSRIQPLSVGVLPVLAILGAGVTAIWGLVTEVRRRAHVFRTQVWLAAGCWVTWFAVAGWTQGTVISLIAGTTALAALSPLFRGAKLGSAEVEAATVRRGAAPERVQTSLEQRWEAHIRHLTGKPVRVTRVEPWDNPRNGQRVHLDLPAGVTWRALSTTEFLENLQGSCRLPAGCVIRILEGEHQAEAMLDVMLRDCLVDEVMADEDYSPASINDEFTVMFDPRGEDLDVCLRSQSAIIGGTVEAGKTTLLHRIIMFLARCVDALIWVVDLNGGGVAEPWVSPWARGLADRPVVDWVAPDEAEAAVLVAVAAAVAKDRKTSREAVRRRRAANSTILPVDRDLPAIIVITDEGGEVRQAVSVLGRMAMEGISRLAQIGRAEAVRAIMSILRGTADLLDKGLRVVSSIRICLRMEEEDEYQHVLGVHPGSTRLIHKGSGYLRRSTDYRPIFARTVNVTLDMIERTAIACAALRPDLDEGGRRVAARLRASDVLGGRDANSFPDLMALPVMQDVETGRAYEGRWDRYAHKLAEMRGEELPDEPESPKPVAPLAAVPASVVEPGSALAALAAAAGITAPAAAHPAAAAVEPEPTRTAVDLDDDAAVDEVAHQLLDNLDLSTSKLTAKDYILAVLNDAYPAPLIPKQIGEELSRRGKEISRTYLQDVLKALKDEGLVQQEKDGQPYSLPPKV